MDEDKSSMTGWVLSMKTRQAIKDLLHKFEATDLSNTGPRTAAHLSIDIPPCIDVFSEPTIRIEFEEISGDDV